MQIDSAQARIIKVIESTLQLSNLDRVASYAFKEKAAPMAATSSVQNDIIGPALSDAQVSRMAISCLRFALSSSCAYFL